MKNILWGLVTTLIIGSYAYTAYTNESVNRGVVRREDKIDRKLEQISEDVVEMKEIQAELRTIMKMMRAYERPDDITHN